MTNQTYTIGGQASDPRITEAIRLLNEAAADEDRTASEVGTWGRWMIRDVTGRYEIEIEINLKKQ